MRVSVHRLCLICLFVCRGDTALHKAASEKLHPVCRLLVEAGASLKKTNFQVFTVNDVTQRCDPRVCPWFSGPVHTNLQVQEEFIEITRSDKKQISQKLDFSVQSRINVLEF